MKYCKKLKEKIVFVTDEIIYPIHNGSCAIYNDVIREILNEGGEVYCISFYRKFTETQEAAYPAEISKTLFCPTWNINNSIRGRASQLVRELKRVVSGDIFSCGIDAFHRSSHREIESFIKDIKPDRIFFNKIHSYLLMKSAIDKLDGVEVVVDLHDDFIAKAHMYRRAFANALKSIGIRAFFIFPREAIRFLMSRVSENKSRGHELEFFKNCDEVYISSEYEYNAYIQMYAALRGKFILRYWPMQQRAMYAGRHKASHCKTFGFLGSSDLLNIDALLAIRDELLPLFGKKSILKIIIGGKCQKIAKLIFGQDERIKYADEFARVEKFYDQIQCAVVPLRYGSGVSVKLIEAMEYVPVISTEVGARGGDYPAVYIAKNWVEFAKEMEILMQT